jgi:hypothetical protein
MKFIKITKTITLKDGFNSYSHVFPPGNYFATPQITYTNGKVASMTVSIFDSRNQTHVTVDATDYNTHKANGDIL